MTARHVLHPVNWHVRPRVHHQRSWDTTFFINFSRENQRPWIEEDPYENRSEFTQWHVQTNRRNKNCLRGSFPPIRIPVWRHYSFFLPHLTDVIRTKRFVTLSCNSWVMLSIKQFIARCESDPKKNYFLFQKFYGDSELASKWPRLFFRSLEVLFGFWWRFVTFRTKKRGGWATFRHDFANDATVTRLCVCDGRKVKILRDG